MREMLFSVVEHHVGINVTVRRGRKWSTLKHDEEILLSSVDHPRRSIKATIVCTLKMPFHQIPDSLLEHEHDPKCQNRSGLLAEMKRVYEGFLGSEEVTVVLYFVN